MPAYMLSAAAPLALSALLLAVLLLAVRHDLLEHRIPNALCAVALAGGVTLQTLGSGSSGFLSAAGGAAVGLLVFLPFYLLRGMGAGDVKLMSATGSFLGPQGALLAAAFTLMLGALFGVGVVVARRFARVPDGAIAQPLAVGLKQKFPYAVAIAGGVLIVMWLQGHIARLVMIVAG